MGMLLTLTGLHIIVKDEVIFLGVKQNVIPTVNLPDDGQVGRNMQQRF
jgi:hypothetical protein